MCGFPIFPWLIADNNTERKGRVHANDISDKSCARDIRLLVGGSNTIRHQIVRKQKYLSLKCAEK